MEIKVRATAYLEPSEQFTAKDRKGDRFRVAELSTTLHYPDRLFAHGIRLNKDGTESRAKGRRLISDFIPVLDLPRQLMVELRDAGILRGNGTGGRNEAAKQAALR